ncbi:MAG TPA: hypothetical protein VK588_02975 [Chitinophagaceae bacterium]|nr:hypothetical protein [Chitinophagaceae bacterium]
MKKIFTLIFSLGLLTAAFAQGGSRHQDDKSNNSSGNQSWNKGDQQKYGHDQVYQATPYSKWDKGNQSNDRIDRDRNGKAVNDRDRLGDRDDRKGSFDNRGSNDSKYYKGFKKRYSETDKRMSPLQLIFGFSIHLK